MQIEYLSYREDLFSRVFTLAAGGPRVFIFAGQVNMVEAARSHEPPFLQPASLFLTLRDFKERFFPPQRLILREEKLAVFFYELLTAAEREELGIDDYFDAIEPAGGFFKLYDEMSEYEIPVLTGLEPWQEKKYEILQAVRRRYLARLDELGYTDATLAFDFSNFYEEPLREFSEIVLVNIIAFTPKEKRLLRFLADRGFRLRLLLQLSPEDFDEELLCLTGVSFPANPGTEIILYQTGDDLLQLTNIIALLEEEEEAVVLDAASSSSYHRLLTGGKIMVDGETGFRETKIYRFLTALYNLLQGAVDRAGVLQVELNSLMQAVRLPEFRTYYGLDETSGARLQEMAGEGYAYFFAPGEFRSVMNDLARLRQVQSMKDLCAFLAGLDLSLLNDRHLAKNIIRYFDALLELESLEELGIVSDWKNYFSRTALGLLRLALNYLGYKKVKPIRDPELEATAVRMTGLREAPDRPWETLVIINASHGVIPAVSGENFLLTDGQRARLGLPAAQERKLAEKYAFFRPVFSSKKAVIFSLKNLEENLTPSSFVEELRLHYGLSPVEAPVKARQLPEVTAGIFAVPDRAAAAAALELEDTAAGHAPVNGRPGDQPGSRSPAAAVSGGAMNGDTALANDWPPVETADFPGKRFSLSYYKYKALSECHFKFYLQYISGVEEMITPVTGLHTRILSPPLFGSLVHELFAEVLNRAGPALGLSPEAIDEIIRDKLIYSWGPKINDYFFKYYQELFLRKIKESLLNFLAILGRRGKKKPVRDLKSEWRPRKTGAPFYRHEITDVYLSGRIDLLLDTGDTLRVVDFKTGAGHSSQLDFYALLLKEATGTEARIEREIYDVLKEKLQPGTVDGEKELAAIIREELTELFASRTYQGVEKPSLCRNCPWLDLCRG
ncbi:MAG: Dna2/Cas4 domain-containing protein [Firmicutes bacterium]|nr:Dna2/Cas4 domain-containing protein [Bacillota bacterium]